jgi:hypothetical protein
MERRTWGLKFSPDSMPSYQSDDDVLVILSCPFLQWDCSLAAGYDSMPVWAAVAWNSELRFWVNDPLNGRLYVQPGEMHRSDVWSIDAIWEIRKDGKSSLEKRSIREPCLQLQSKYFEGYMHAGSYQLYKRSTPTQIMKTATEKQRKWQHAANLPPLARPSQHQRNYWKRNNPLRKTLKQNCKFGQM